MIYTLTLNPAIDYIIQIENYTDGAVNRTSSEKLLPGGKGLNVSTVLTNLGIDNTALGFVSGFSGKAIEDMLSDLGVKNDFIHLGEGFSRINVKIKAKTETEINAQGPTISDAALNKLYQKLDVLQDDDTLILAGSVPSSLPGRIYCEILERLKEKKLNIIVDATKDLLTNTLKFKPFLIKPNNFELQEIFKRKLTTDSEFIECAKELQNMGAKNVIVSLGGDGAILICEDGRIFKSVAPNGKVINTTGAGDSLVAGFVAGFEKSADFEYALKMGICAGSASAFSENLATHDEIFILFENSPSAVLLV